MGNRRSHAKGGSSPLWHWTRESAPGSTAQAPQHTLCWQTPTLILDPELLQVVVVITDRHAKHVLLGRGSDYLHSPTHSTPPGFVFACSSSQHSFTQCYSDFLFEPVIISAWAPPVSTIKSLMYMFILNLCKSWVYLFLEIIFQKWSGLSNSLSPRRESCNQPEFCLFIDYVVFPSRCLSSSSLSLKIHVIIDEWSLFWHGELKNRVDSLQLKPNF